MAKSKKKGLGARYQKSFESKDAGGANTDVMNWSAVKDGVQFYKPKEGMNKIIIVPYKIKTENHPLVHSGDNKIGDLDYMMDLYVHRRVGPTDKDAICLKQTYGKACPLCEAAKEFKANGDEKAFTLLRASRRVYYNVYNARKIDDGLMVFSGVSHYLFEKEMIEEARGSSEDGDIIDFADLEDGMIVKFRGAPDSFDGNEFMKFKSFDFINREEELEEGIEDEAVSFDEILIMRTAKDLEQLLYEDSEEKADKEEDEEADEPPKRKKTSKKEEPEAEEDEDEDDPEPEKEKKKDKKKDTKKDSGKKKDSEEIPCPHGHTFGEDCDGFEECDDCKSWEECSEA